MVLIRILSLSNNTENTHKYDKYLDYLYIVVVLFTRLSHKWLWDPESFWIKWIINLRDLFWIAMKAAVFLLKKSKSRKSDKSC